MAQLKRTPGSSTSKQRQVLHQIKRRRGWTDDQLHDAIGIPSTTLLSSAEASDHIRRLGAMELANPPGEKPAPYARRKATPGVTRMIAGGHVDHIMRLLRQYFGDDTIGLAWLKKDFDVEHPHDLLTARRAGQVIRVLKDMVARRGENNETAPRESDRTTKQNGERNHAESV